MEPAAIVDATPTDPNSLALAEARKSLNWYQRNREATRLRFQVAEVVLLSISAAVPVSGSLTPHDSRLPTIIGAVVVALTGLRAVFHWRDNWIRSATTASMIDGEIRLYEANVEPYDKADTKAARLIKRLNAIESSEYASWASLAGPGTAKA